MILTAKSFNDNTENMQYVVFMLTNIRCDDVEHFLPDMKALHGDNDPKSGRMYAFGVVGPFILNHTVARINEQVDKWLDLAEKYDIPIYFQMDDCKQYFTFHRRPTEYFKDDKNCVHKNSWGKRCTHFYTDPEMCEWIALPKKDEKWGGQQYGKLPRWLCDWGDVKNFAHVKGGFPCFNSETYLKWYDNQINEGFIKPLANRLKKWQNEGKDYLFAGVCTGWETMIPDYQDDAVISSGLSPFYAKLYPWEKTQYGMHAIYNLKDESGERLYDTDEKLSKAAEKAGLTLPMFKRELLYKVIHGYIEHTCKLFHDAGISRMKILSHTVSRASLMDKADTFASPVWVNVNDYCLPAWSMAVSCPYDMKVISKTIAEKAPGLNAYANAEGYTSNGGGNEQACKKYIEDFLGGNARLITIFGYDYGAAKSDIMGYPRDKDFYFTKLIKDWRTKKLLPEYDFNRRPEMK
ncbi:MAG: hypothetical protein SPL13_02505 [Clostridia bacterium]|nr:hypothetical protein [Clostridia bacterium]